MFPYLQSNVLWQLWEETKLLFVIGPQREGMSSLFFLRPLWWHNGIYFVEFVVEKLAG